MIVEGIVKGIQPYGVFIQMKMVLLDYFMDEDISISRIKQSPNERFEIGQKDE